MPMHITCRNCGYEAEFPDAEEARDNNWWQDDAGDWFCSDCHGYCRLCDTHVSAQEAEWSDNLEGYVCDCCRENETSRCDYCDQLELADDAIYGSNENGAGICMCRRCYDRMREEGRIRNEDGAITVVNPGQGNSEFILQQNLHPEIWEEISHCQDCRNGEMQCPKCLRKMATEQELEETTLWLYDNRARSYHFSAHNHFKSTKLRQQHEHPFLYYGAEWEVLFRDSTDINQIAKEFIEATGGLFVAEFDRSVSDQGNGIEFISRPLSYKKWMEESTYQLLQAGKKVLDKYHAYTPQPDSCGLHIHMSLQFFERNTEKSVKQIKSDIDWMFQIYQEEIEKISRRRYTRYCASKAFRLKEVFNGTRFNDYAFNLNPTIQIEKGNLTISSGSGNTHHDAIIQTFRTIEVRTFKSPSTIEELLGTIEFCRCVAHASRNMNLTSKTTLGDIVWCKDSKYLPDLLKKTKVNLDKKFSNKLEVKI